MATSSRPVRRRVAHGAFAMCFREPPWSPNATTFLLLQRSGGRFCVGASVGAERGACRCVGASANTFGRGGARNGLEDQVSLLRIAVCEG